MSIIAWLVLGLIAGFIGSKVVTNSGKGVVVDIIVGIVGAFIGGLLFNFFGASGVTGFNLYSVFVATMGSIVLLAVYYAFSSRRSTA